MEKLNNFFQKNNIKPTPWAIQNDIAPPVISRLLSGKKVSPKNALKIEQATNGAVTRMELLYPSGQPEAR